VFRERELGVIVVQDGAREGCPTIHDETKESESSQVINDVLALRCFRIWNHECLAIWNYEGGDEISGV
jgi:hypothetical protein